MGRLLECGECDRLVFESEADSHLTRHNRERVVRQIAMESSTRGDGRFLEGLTVEGLTVEERASRAMAEAAEQIAMRGLTD
jgi:hypothetical protein